MTCLALETKNDDRNESKTAVLPIDVRYFTSCQKGVHLHPLTPPKSTTAIVAVMIFTFCPATIVLRDPNPKYIPVYSSMAFFQLFNSYDCCNLQLFSVENKQGNIYNVLCGGVSFFYKTNDRKYMYCSLAKECPRAVHLIWHSFTYQRASMFVVLQLCTIV